MAGDFVTPWGAVVDAIPFAVFVVDEDVRVIDANEAGLRMLRTAKDSILKRRGGDILHCVHALETEQGCGGGPACGDCVIRNSVAACLAGQPVKRRRTKMQLEVGGGWLSVELMITASRIDAEQGVAVLMVDDISEYTSLKEIISICSHCRKIQNDQRDWQRVEAFFKEQVGVDFSHAICPDCRAEHYPEVKGWPDATSK